MTDHDSPDEIVVSLARAGIRVRASDARAIIKATGKTLTALMQSDDMADQIQAVAFIALRRREREDQPTPGPGEGYHYRDPLETWAIAEEIDVDLDAGDSPSPDPLNETSS